MDIGLSSPKNRVLGSGEPWSLISIWTEVIDQNKIAEGIPLHSDHENAVGLNIRKLAYPSEADGTDNYMYVLSRDNHSLILMSRRPIDVDTVLDCLVPSPN